MVESTPLQIAGLSQMPAVQVGLLSRTGSPQVQLPATQTSSSNISPMSGTLFTEDRLNTSGIEKRKRCKIRQGENEKEKEDKI